MNVSVIARTDKRYPILLKNIPDSPKKLYCKGEWNEKIFQNCLAVVGSRQLTSYGKKAAEQLVGEIAAAGITIVSGFMYGGDAAAHKAALDCGGKTIAVMPCGIDIIHPVYQKNLYNEILERDGLIISEFPKNAPPLSWMYPRRNRIVAGLSRAILVLEAALDSGTLITADLAKKYNRKVFALPGQIFSEVSQGSLKLIKEGASLVSCPKDILDYFEKTSLQEDAQKFTPIKIVDPTEKKIINELKREPLSADDLSRNIGIGAAKIGVILSLMQIKGIIKTEGIKYYVD